MPWQQRRQGTPLAWSHGLSPATTDLVHVHVRGLALSKACMAWESTHHPAILDSDQRVPLFPSQPSRCLRGAVDGRGRRGLLTPFLTAA